MIKKPNASKEPDFIHPKEFAYRMQVHPDTALRLARQGKIDGAVKIGGQWRMPNNRKQQQ